MGHLTEDMRSVVDVFSLTEVNSNTTSNEAKLTRFLKSVPLVAWTPLPSSERDIVLSISPKSGHLVAFEFLKNGEIVVQHHLLSCGGRVEGLEFSEQATYFWSDLGSLGQLLPVSGAQTPEKLALSIFNKTSSTKEVTPPTQKAKDSSKKQAAEKTAFPTTFFEKCKTITDQITISSPDFNYNSDSAKKRLATLNEFIASSSDDSLTLTLSHTLPSQYLAGIRVFVGNNNFANIPAELKLGGRSVKTKPDVKHWYDLPLTYEEIGASKNQIKLVASATHSKSAKPAIDSLEVYTCPREVVDRELGRRLRKLEAENAKYDVPLEELTLGQDQSLAKKSLAHTDFSISEKALSCLLDFLLVHQQTTQLITPALADLTTSLLDLIRPLSSLQNLPEVLERVKALFATFTAPDKFFELFDPLDLSLAADFFSSRVSSLEALHYHLSLFNHVGLSRFGALSEFLSKHEDFGNTLGRRFVAFLDENALPETYNCEALFASFLTAFILCGCHLARGKLSLAPLQSVLEPLLFHEKLRVGTLTSLSLIRLSELSLPRIRELFGSSKAVGPHSLSFKADESEEIVAGALEETELSRLLSDLQLALLDIIPTTLSKGGMTSLPFLQLIFVTSASQNRLRAEGKDNAFTSRLLDLVFDQILPLLKPDSELKLSPSLETRTLLMSMIFLLARPGIEEVNVTPADSLAVNFVVVPERGVREGVMAHLTAQISSDDLLTLSKRLLPLVRGLLSKSSEAEGHADQKLKVERTDETLDVYPPFITLDYLGQLQENDEVFTHCYFLLSEVVLRLSILLWWKTPLDKAETRKIAEWTDIACQYTSVRSDFAEVCGRNLLFAISKDRDICLKAIDQHEISTCLDAAKVTYQKIAQNKGLFNYEDATHLSSHLNKLSEITAKRPLNWQRYCLEHRDTLPFLYDCLLQSGTERGIASLRLLRLGLSATPALKLAELKTSPGQASKGSKNLDTALLAKAKADAKEASVVEVVKDHPVETLITAEQVAHFLNTFSFDRQNSKLRSESVEFLYWAWRFSSWTKRAEILDALVAVFPSTPVFGFAVSEAISLIAYIVHRISLESGNQESVEGRRRLITSLHQTFMEQNRAILNHPNSYIYEALANFVDVNGYYLESDPCLSCNFPETPFVNSPLDSLKAEIKVKHPFVPD